jgi:hypothetical protein
MIFGMYAMLLFLPSADSLHLAEKEAEDVPHNWFLPYVAA